jgi:hypothetical protein
MLNLTLSNWSLLSARISSQESIVELGPLNVTIEKGAMGGYNVLPFYTTLSSISKTQPLTRSFNTESRKTAKAVSEAAVMPVLANRGTGYKNQLQRYQNREIFFYSCPHCCGSGVGSGSGSVRSICFWASRIRIH